MSKELIERVLSFLEDEKVNLSPEQCQRLAELSKAGENVRKNVADTLETKEKRELSPEQTEKLIQIFKNRFVTKELSNAIDFSIGKFTIRFGLSENKKLRKVINFADVEKALRAAPEKLYALHKLEETGGEPQVIGIDSDEFVFEDRSIESPHGRIGMDFDDSLAQAEGFDVDMQSPESYKAMQKTGKYDTKTSSWLGTDPRGRKITGYVFYGNYTGGVSEVHNTLYSFFHTNFPVGMKKMGWRASLRVKKV